MVASAAAVCCCLFKRVTAAGAVSSRVVGLGGAVNRCMLQPEGFAAAAAAVFICPWGVTTHTETFAAAAAAAADGRGDIKLPLSAIGFLTFGHLLPLSVSVSFCVSVCLFLCPSKPVSVSPCLFLPPYLFLSLSVSVASSVSLCLFRSLLPD